MLTVKQYLQWCKVALKTIALIVLSLNSSIPYNQKKTFKWISVLILTLILGDHRIWKSFFVWSLLVQLVRERR